MEPLWVIAGHFITRELFAEWLAAPLGIRVGAREREPQGGYLRGQNKAASPPAVLPSRMPCPALCQRCRSSGRTR